MHPCVSCGQPTSGRRCTSCGPSAPAVLPPPAPSGSRPFAPPPLGPGHPAPVAGPVTPSVARPAVVFRDEVGTVVSTPYMTARPPGLERHLGRVLLLVALLVVLKSPALLGAVLFWILLFVALQWFLGRVGLGMLSMLLLRGRGRGSTPPEIPTLGFRCQFASDVREVRLRGWDAGIQLGDQVAVTGLGRRNFVDAATVANRSNGTVLRRVGLGRLVALWSLLAFLLLFLVA